MKHTLVFHFLGTSKRLQKAVGFSSQPRPLSYSQAATLLVIPSQKEISQAEIAKHLQLEPASIVTLIDELEKLNLVKRNATPNNRRKYRIDLTEAGKLQVKTIRKQANEIEKLVHSILKPKEAERIFEITEKINLALDTWQGTQKQKRGGVNEERLSNTNRHLAL